MDSKDTKKQEQLSFLQEGGNSGALIRGMDWGKNALGDPEHWPLLLKHVTSMMLSATLPVMICWGPGFIQLYNDAFRPILGATKHPGALGAHSEETFAEIWATTGPLLQKVMNGETVSIADFMVSLERNGYPEVCYFDFSYSPIRDEHGVIHGVLVTCIETTTKVQAINNLNTSRENLKNTILQAQSLNEALATTNEKLKASNDDLAAVNEELKATNEELIETQHELESAHNELAESESMLKRAIEFTNLGTWDYNVIADKMYLSRECRAIFGLPADMDLTFETFFTYFHPDDNTSFKDTIRHYATASASDKFDITCRILRYDNNEIRWIRVRGTTYFNEEKQVVRSLATILDISETKQAEEKSAKLAAIVESSDDAILSKTLESVITSWNDSAERMFGYTAEEMIGETIYKLIPNDRYDEEPHILSRLKSGERVEHFETQRLTRDGRLIDVSLTISPIKNIQGQIIGLSKIVRDITEKKRDEQRKSDFIGMASHELKTPLTSLKAILQVLDMKLGESPDEFISGAVNKANIQVNRMINMINGFLNISRLESGKIAIEKHTFNLRDMIEEVIKEMQFISTTHIIRLDLCDSLTVEADYDKIASVVTNLISNAIKYSPSGTTVEVLCERIGDMAQVSIRDQGIGVKEHDRKKLFERYYRVENEDIRRIPGFGIGLYLSSEIVQCHQGNIWVVSAPGQGSTFYFNLPAMQNTPIHGGNRVPPG